MAVAVNNFDVLKQMAADNKDIRLGIDVVQLKKVKAGTEVTVGIGGDVVGSVYRGDLNVCLILFNKKQFDELKSTIQSNSGPEDALRALKARAEAAEHELSRHASIEEKSHLQTIDERDAAEEALSQAYFLIKGESPQWSNLFGYEQALADIDDAQRCLRTEIKSNESRLAILDAQEVELPTSRFYAHISAETMRTDEWVSATDYNELRKIAFDALRAVKACSEALKGLLHRHADGTDERYWAEWDAAMAAARLVSSPVMKA